MANPKINIASLDFDSIKTSLKTYLTSLNEFQGYDFEASGMNVLLDILSYNTLYYAFYSNMIANETFLDTAKIENNIVSLVKPLGYLVSGRAAAKTEITVKSVASTDTLTAYTDYFTGNNLSGASYRFYPIQNYTLASGTATDIILYEGNSVAKDLPVAVDITEQKAFLGTTSIDINTLTVKVNGVTWNKYNNFEPDPGPESEVYFLDRTSSGFYLIFGKKTLNDYQASYGKEIAENDVVTVSYLVPSGEVANGISPIRNSKVTIVTSIPSGNGANSVDLDLVKFFAPKQFAANDRAVTKDDYYGLLFASGLLPSTVTEQNQVNVWGGEEADPPAFGRVFVSYADPELTIESPSVKKSIAFLKQKAVVTVLPEYTQPQEVGVDLNITATGAKTSETAGIKALVEDYYNSAYGFNKNINLTDLKTLISESYPNVRRVDVTSSVLKLNIVGSGSEKAMYFKNELETPTTTGAVVSSTGITYNGVIITLADKSINNTEGTLVALNTSSGIISAFGNMGTVNYTTGAVSVNENVLSEGTTTTISAKPKFIDSITIKNEFLVNVTATVTAA
jgi:hypothetical protein